MHEQLQEKTKTILLLNKQLTTLTEKIQEKQREVLLLTGELNTIQKQCSHTKNELYEMYKEIDDKLNQKESNNGLDTK